MILQALTRIIILLSFSFNVFASPFPGLNKIIERGEITVSFTPNETAIFTIIDDNGNLSGIDVDIANLIARELGVKLNLKTTASDWNSVVEEVMNQEADFGISYLSMTSSRIKKVAFSEPYVKNRQVLLFNNLSLEQQRNEGNFVIADMFAPNKGGLQIGVFAGSSYEVFAKETFPGVKMSGYDTTLNLINNLLDRKIDAILIDEIELHALFKKDPGLKIKLTEVVLKDKIDVIAIAVDPYNKDLLNFINNVIKLKQLNYTVRSAYEIYKHKGYDQK